MSDLTFAMRHYPTTLLYPVEVDLAAERRAHETMDTHALERLRWREVQHASMAFWPPLLSLTGFLEAEAEWLFPPEQAGGA